ncbi:MAG: hypothetical protein HFI72_03355 [Peptococcaceae bacterium]|jgi:type I restriction enzyme S subunit|nr:hypothetical protein [Peptococcaceae bacterium]
MMSVRAPVGDINIADIEYCIGRGLCALTPLKMNINYSWYMLSCISEPLKMLSTGTTYEAVSIDDIKNIYIVYPKKNIQSKISDYLDRKIAAIDTLIADKQKMIELLKESRQAIISEAVTKGLDKNAKMKDSGIEWIGEIPEDWEVVPITKYLNSLIDYRGKTPNKVEEGIFLVTARNIKNGIIDYSLSQEYVSICEYESIMHRGKPQIGDVLFTTEAPLGEVANIDNEDIALAQRVIKFCGKDNILNNYYLKYWMLSSKFKEFLLSLSTGSTAEGIKGSKLFLLKMPIPQIDIQKTIVIFLDKKTTEIDNLIIDITTQIEKLKEYRQAIISEAVTGKVEI